MFEKFTTEGGDTFRRRYEGTFGYYINRSNGGQRLLVQLVSFGGRNGEVLHFKNIDGIEYTLNANTDSDIGFEFVPPEKRYYPHAMYGAVLGARVVARQFSRGLCENNYTLRTWSPRRLNFETLPVNFQEVHNILEGSPKPQQAFQDWIKSPKTAMFYLSPLFALVVAIEGVKLYLYDRHIATLTATGESLTVVTDSFDPIFTAEVTVVANLLGFKDVIYE